MLDQWIRGALQETANRCRLTLELYRLLPSLGLPEASPKAKFVGRSENDGGQ